MPDVVDSGTAGALGRGGNVAVGIGAGIGSVYLGEGAYEVSVGKLGSSSLLFFLLSLSNIPIK